LVKYQGFLGGREWVLGFEFRALFLLGRCSTTSAIPPVVFFFFASVIFQEEACVFALGQPQSTVSEFLPIVSYITGITGMFAC
jgi:hypothetical protein